MRDRDSRFHFAYFAARPEYHAVTRDFVRRTLRTRFQPGQEQPRRPLVVDLASGTGIGARAAAEILAGRPASVLALDHDPDLVALGREAVGPAEPRPRFVVADGCHIPLGDSVADAVYLLNAIHEIPGLDRKSMVLGEAARTLRPGGTLHVSSTFTAEMFEGTGDALGYMRWKSRAVKRLGGGKDPEAPRFEAYTTEQYCQLLEAVGLRVDRSGIRRVPVPLTAESLRAIARYPPFIEGQFMDMAYTDEFPLEQKSDALIAIMDEMEAAYRRKVGDPQAVFALTRNWIEITADKPLRTS